ncbi:MAG: leucyl/phenylalanyl-tRNA--protein transferase [Gammaproteobacteria bacterium]|nr:MAG: leucyl/phenylalanyl-tRNA--protein transferase [Gammaproteobacteria bacterium]RLA22292.1 MAG: leucyl/phenylalanyl-tRNA--protein transferase [Gammaproteobacteria bacterium]
MLPLLDPSNPFEPFPDSDLALNEPNGLLAVGGCLSTERLINAYQHGIFPWYSQDEPILWWTPSPRLVIYPENLKISKSLRKTVRKGLFNITFDSAFSEVIEQCGSPRSGGDETWITEEIKEAYLALHKKGFAHSVEAWQDDKLVGGLYGVSIGAVFFGESMFSHISNASKVAFVTLVTQLQKAGYQLIDCQVRTEHLISLGAEEISREQFSKHLKTFCAKQPSNCFWNDFRN